MRQAYLIMAHQGLDKVDALIERLLAGGKHDVATVHLDRRTGISDETLIGWASRYDGRVRVAPRVRCRWGHYSLVSAMMNLIAATDPESYDYAHLLSGKDWPVVPAETLRLQIEPGRLYLSFEHPEKPERMTGYHFNDFNLGANAHRTDFHYCMDLALRRAGRIWTQALGPRPCPVGPAWRKGSQWWSLPREAVLYALPQLHKIIDGGHLRYTQCSDEHVMQTVLAASPFADRLSENRRFIRWGDASSPELLTAADAPTVRASDAWFMRKVDAEKDDFFLLF